MRRMLVIVSAVGLVWGLLIGTGHSATVDQDGDGVAAGDCAPLNPAVHANAADLPDLQFADTNCDGIDGDLDGAWFVAPDGTDANPGTALQPFATLQKAVAAAAGSEMKQIYVSVGTYDRVGLGANASGIGLYGGYERGPWSRTTATPATVTGAPEALLIQGATDVVVQLMSFAASPNSNRSAYGVRAVAGAELLLSRVDVTAADGTAGSTGGGGFTPAKPAKATDGSNGTCNGAGGGGWSSPPSGHSNGGAGGVGGEETNDGEDGVDGFTGSNNATGYGLGGDGGISRSASDPWSPTLNGGTGGVGSTGGAGADGAGGGNSLTGASQTWTGMAGGSGGSGGIGGGGGGGGGGAGRGNMWDWAAGGGGGQGGFGGRGGSGGQGGGWGGASFGLYLHNATAVVTDASSVAAGNGGEGGNGGDGGSGGSGGDGGLGGSGGSGCNTTAGSGGTGGVGGPGGRGGHGGGGPGGPSAAVLRAGTTSFATVSDDSSLTAGSGGNGGDSSGAGDGANGQAGALLGTTSASAGDFDGDGMTDAADACPATNRGAADANGDGCPEAPQTSLTGGPRNGSVALTNKASFGLGSTESATTFACSLNGAAATVCTSPRRFNSLPQRTSVLRVWASDSAGTPDPSAATRTWTVPVNNTNLGHSKGWTKKTGSRYYLGSYSTTKAKGATLSKSRSGLRRVALVATKGPGFGKVNVYLGTTLLKRIDLSASRLAKRQLLSVASFSTVKSGTVRARVVSSGKPVRIEGLALVTG